MYTPAGPDLSAVKALDEKLERLVSVVDELRRKVNEISCPNFETNTTFREKGKDIPIEGPIPMDDLIALEGSLDGKSVQVLKDDGCNTNVVSQEFFEKNRKYFNWKKCDVEVSHSQRGAVETSSEAILGATLTIGKTFVQV